MYLIAEDASSIDFQEDARGIGGAGAEAYCNELQNSTVVALLLRCRSYDSSASTHSFKKGGRHMTDDKLVPGENNPGGQVQLSTGASVSLQVLQQVYNEVTGRTESLARRYDTNHCVDMSDLCQLNAKICQLHEQYNITAAKCSVTIYHLDDQRQVFSSFERFRMFDSSTLSPVENIRFEYEFLIVLPKTQKTQTYELEINLHSRAAMMERAKQESSLPPSFLMRTFASMTGNMSIEYVDYTVARNFQIAVDGWFKGLRLTSESSWIRFLQKNGEYLPGVFRFLSVLSYLIACFYHFTPLLRADTHFGEKLYVAGVATFGGVFLLSIVAGQLGGLCEDSIQFVRPLSYLNLTRGDADTYQRLKDENEKRLLVGGFSLLMNILINVFSNWLTSRLGL